MNLLIFYYFKKYKIKFFVKKILKILFIDFLGDFFIVLYEKCFFLNKIQNLKRKLKIIYF